MTQISRKVQIKNRSKISVLSPRTVYKSQITTRVEACFLVFVKLVRARFNELIIL